MEDLRLMGSMIQKLATENGDTPNQLSTILGCSQEAIIALYKGRMFLSFAQLEQLAEHFGVTVEALLTGDDAYYTQNVVHCMGKFEDPRNREEILDIIDDYLNLKASIQ